MLGAIRNCVWPFGGLLLCVSSMSCSDSQPAPSSTSAPQPDATSGLPPILDGGGGIPDAPNGPSLCPTGECNYQTQVGCSVEGGTPKACQPYPNGEGSVQPTCATAGSRLEGEDCTSWTDCSAGLLCVADKCRALCCGGDYTACQQGEHCFSTIQVLVGDAGVSSGAMICSPVGGCDPLDGGPCPSGQACHIIDSTGAVACTPEATGQANQPCPCAAGFVCIVSGCRRLCKAVEGGGDPACPEAEGQCIHYDRDPEGVGECVPQG